jgi:hypothetical protein
MRLGMMGIPVDPTPDFPSDEKLILLTESSASDPEIISRLESFVKDGGDAVITSGFMYKLGEELNRCGLTEAKVTGRKLNVTRYQITDDRAGYIDDAKPVTFSEIVHGNNASWSLINGGDGDYHTPILLRSDYGKGRMFILSIPDNPSDLYRIPRPVADRFKRIISPDCFASGRDFSMFTYSDGSMILYRYVKDDIRPAHVRLYTEKEVSSLKDVVTGEVFEVSTCYFAEKWDKKICWVADIVLVPGVFRRLKWE